MSNFVVSVTDDVSVVPIPHLSLRPHLSEPRSSVRDSFNKYQSKNLGILKIINKNHKKTLISLKQKQIGDRKNLLRQQIVEYKEVQEKYLEKIESFVKGSVSDLNQLKNA